MVVTTEVYRNEDYGKEYYAHVLLNYISVSPLNRLYKTLTSFLDCNSQVNFNKRKVYLPTSQQAVPTFFS